MIVVYPIYRLEKKITQTNAKIEKMQRDMRTKEDLKTVALGTSKINYLDPRITVAWCKRHEVPIEKVLAASLVQINLFFYRYGYQYLTLHANCIPIWIKTEPNRYESLCLFWNWITTCHWYLFTTCYLYVLLITWNFRCSPNLCWQNLLGQWTWTLTLDSEICRMVACWEDGLQKFFFLD